MNPIFGYNDGSVVVDGLDGTLVSPHSGSASRTSTSRPETVALSPADSLHVLIPVSRGIRSLVMPQAHRLRPYRSTSIYPVCGWHTAITRSLIGMLHLARLLVFRRVPAPGSMPTPDGLYPEGSSSGVRLRSRGGNPGAPRSSGGPSALRLTVEQLRQSTFR